MNWPIAIGPMTNPSLLYRVWSLRSGQTGMIDPTRDPDGIAFGIIEII